MTPSRPGGSRGSTLVMNLFALAVFALLGTVVYRIVQFQVREAVYQERLAQAHYIAEAGLEDALHSLYQNPAWRTGFANKPFAGGSYTVSLSTDASPVVTATGYSQRIVFLGPAVKSVSATAAISYSTAAAGASYALMANTSAEVDGPSSVDSYDPFVSLTPASFAFGGNVWSNASIKTTAGASVNGNAYYGTAQSVAAGTVLGAVARSTYTQTVPGLLCPACLLANNNLTGISGAGSCYDSSAMDLHLNGSGVTCTLAAGTYYFRNITVKGTLNADTTGGPVTIYFTGTLSTTPGCSINNLGKKPSQLSFYGQNGGGSHTLQCAAPLHAYLDDPTAQWTIQTPLYGRVLGDKITVKGAGLVHGDLGGSQGPPTRVAWAAGSWSQGYERQ